MKGSDVFNGRLAVHPAEALFASGISESLEKAQKTARNMRWAGTFPFPLKKVGRHEVVLVADILACLDAGGESFLLECTKAAEAPKRRPGRPPNKQVG